jgi:hypothetical protein
MKINRILIIAAVFLTAFTGYNLAQKTANGYNYTGESIQYITKPAGESEYSNLGTVDFKGLKANLLTLKTRVLFVQVMEKIFYNPENLLPYKTERFTSGFWVKEYRTEEYDQEKFTVTVKIFKGKKLAKEKIIKADGPIQNINLLLFYLRKQPDLKIGWQAAVKVPDELKLFKFNLKLVSMEEVTVPAGTFQAYHFKSSPAKYEIWIDKSDQRIPVQIKQKSIIDCSILMKKYKAAK